MLWMIPGDKPLVIQKHCLELFSQANLTFFSSQDITYMCTMKWSLS